MAVQWQIALAVLVGFLMGTLCTWLACCITDKTPPPGSSGDQEKVDPSGVGKGDE